MSRRIVGWMVCASWWVCGPVMAQDADAPPPPEAGDTPVQADPIIAFSTAKNAFDAGDYAEAAARFERLIARNLANPALEIEVRKYLGVAYLFLGDQDRAEQQFLALLDKDPDFRLDPLVFPIDAVDFFTAIRARYQERLRQLAAQRQQEEERRRREEERRRQEEIARLTKVVYVRERVVRHYRIVAFLPLGIGQFQNGHATKGWWLFGVQSALFAGAVTTFALHEGLRDNARTPYYDASVRRTLERMETGYRVANLACVVGLGVVYVYGVIDALYHFRPEVRRWEKVPETQVPASLRHRRVRTSWTPWWSGHGGGVAVAGWF